MCSSSAERLSGVAGYVKARMISSRQGSRLTGGGDARPNLAMEIRVAGTPPILENRDEFHSETPLTCNGSLHTVSMILIEQRREGGDELSNRICLSIRE